MTEDPEQAEWFSAPEAPTLTGAEELHGVDGAQVVDFWRFAMSDLRMNNVRGYFAEYLVARAVGATGPASSGTPMTPSPLTAPASR